MKQFLTPRWVIAHLAVAMIAILFINLGFWQLRRLGERRLENAVAASRYQEAPQRLEDLLATSGNDIESLRYRRVTAQGVYSTQEEVLTRNQIYQEQAGFHVIDPLVLNDGTAVLVNRGWVPLELDQPPIRPALPPLGTVSIEGWINTSQVRPSFGPIDPAGAELDVFNRVDIHRIQAQIEEELVPVYIVLERADPERLPVALSTPVFTDQGSHLAYAIQWFGFTLIGLVGYGFLIRRSRSRAL